MGNSKKEIGFLKKNGKGWNEKLNESNKKYLLMMHYQQTISNRRKNIKGWNKVSKYYIHINKKWVWP
jgi:hypothetical protein